MLLCDGCDRELLEDLEYIKDEADNRYCERCFEPNSITYYEVGGESVGTDEEVSYFYGLLEEKEYLEKLIEMNTTILNRRKNMLLDIDPVKAPNNYVMMDRMVEIVENSVRRLETELGYINKYIS